jgi:hypothetical protein
MRHSTWKCLKNNAKKLVTSPIDCRLYCPIAVCTPKVTVQSAPQTCSCSEKKKKKIPSIATAAAIKALLCIHVFFTRYFKVVTMGGIQVMHSRTLALQKTYPWCRLYGDRQKPLHKHGRVAPIDRRLYFTIAVRTPAVGDRRRTVGATNMFL